MTDYTVRIGTGRRQTAAADLYSIPYRCEADDGRIILHVGNFSPRCADCRRGTLQWAEAGYVPWHRICDHCGSHWDLHPITWGPARPRDTMPRLVGTGVYHCGHQVTDPPWCETCQDEVPEITREEPVPAVVRWVDGVGDVPIDPTEPLGESGQTWGDLLALVKEEHWAEASRPERVRQMAGSVVISCAWARRSQFYRG
jgi:hypothetical protein